MSQSFSTHIAGMIQGDEGENDIIEGGGPRQPITKTIELQEPNAGKSRYIERLDKAWDDWMARPDPEAGVFVGMGFEEYREIKAVNISSLTWGVEGDTNEVREKILYPTPATKNMRIGTAVHAFLLEPGTKRVALGPVNEKTGEVYGKKTKAWAEYQAERPGVLLFDVTELQRIHHMAEAVLAHKSASKLVGDVGETEVVLVWQDEKTGIWCKARTDKLIRRGAMIVDYKSAASAAPGAFSAQLDNFNYYNQGEWYLTGAATLAKQGFNIEKGGEFVFIVGKNTSPYSVGVYELDADSRAMGQIENREMLAALAKCMKTNQWPAFGDEIRPIGCPLWKLIRFKEGAM